MISCEDQDAFMASNSQRRVNIKLNQMETFGQAASIDYN